ncbi:hypothetical protein ACVI55_000013 [Sinorhizobium medicae]
MNDVGNAIDPHTACVALLPLPDILIIDAHADPGTQAVAVIERDTGGKRIGEVVEIDRGAAQLRLGRERPVVANGEALAASRIKP